MTYEEWRDSLPKCLPWDQCDGDLVGEEHVPHCPMYGKQWATLKDAFEAGQQTSKQAEQIRTLIRQYSARNAEALGLLEVDGRCDCSQCDTLRAERQIYSEFTAQLEIILDDMK